MKKIKLLAPLLGAAALASTIIPMSACGPKGQDKKPIGEKYAHDWNTSGVYVNPIAHSTLKYCNPENFNDTYLAEVANNPEIFASDLLTSFNRFYDDWRGAGDWELNAEVSGISVKHNNAGYTLSFTLKAVFEGNYMSYGRPISTWYNTHQHRQELSASFTDVKIKLSNYPWSGVDRAWGIGIDLDNTDSWSGTGTEIFTVDTDAPVTKQFSIDQNSDAATKEEFNKTFVFASDSILYNMNSIHFVDVASKEWNVSRLDAIEGYSLDFPTKVTNKDTSIKLNLKATDQTTPYYPGIALKTADGANTLVEWMPDDTIQGNVSEINFEYINQYTQYLTSDVGFELTIYNHSPLNFGTAPTHFTLTEKPTNGYYLYNESSGKYGFGKCKVTLDDDVKNNLYEYVFNVTDKTSTANMQVKSRNIPGENTILIDQCNNWGNIGEDWTEGFTITQQANKIEFKSITNFGQVELPDGCVLIQTKWDRSKKPYPYIEQQDGTKFTWSTNIWVDASSEIFNKQKNVTINLKQNGSTRATQTQTKYGGNSECNNDFNLSGNWADLTNDPVTLEVVFADPQN